MRTKTAAVVAAAALGLTAVGGTAAWAYFSGVTNANATGGQNGNMAALVKGTATYSYDNTTNVLFPGHKATVKIPLQNTNPVDVSIETVVAGTAGGTCASEIELSATTWKLFNGATEVANQSWTDAVIPAGQTYDLVIVDGVKLKETATNTCENKSFSSSWNITAENR